MDPVSEIETHAVCKEKKPVTPKPPPIEETSDATTVLNANQGPYKADAFGGDGGTYFEYMHFDDATKRYRRVKKVEVSIEDMVAMRGIRVTFDDNQAETAGEMAKYSSTFGRAEIFPMDIGGSEMITQTTIYTCPLINFLSLSTPMVNGIVLKTSQGKSLDRKAGTRPVINVSLQPEQHEDTTRGFLIGIYGRSGSSVDQLGLIFELPVAVEYILEDVEYQLEALKHVDQKPVTIKTDLLENPSPATVTMRETVRHTFSTTHNWSNTSELKVGLKATIKGGVPQTSEYGVELSGEINTSFQTGGGSTEEVEEEWEVEIAVPPESSVQMTVTAKKSVIDVPYTAKMRTRMSDGSEALPQKVSGTYQGVSVHNLSVKAVPVSD